MRCGNLTYDPWNWLKITSMSSTASVLKFHHSIQKYFSSKTSKKGDLGHYLSDFKDLSGFESLSGLYDLKRHDYITGLNDLNSLFGLKKSKAASWLISMPSGTSAA